MLGINVQPRLRLAYYLEAHADCTPVNFIYTGKRWWYGPTKRGLTIPVERMLTRLAKGKAELTLWVKEVR